MRNKRVLVIDDDRQIALALSIRLQAAGYEVTTAYDGEAGLEQLGHSALPDIVVLDIRMPGIDGLEVARYMRSDTRLESIPIIFLSANAQERVKQAALQAGGQYFLEKPFEARVLLDTLERALSEAPLVP
jgi:CheY-like chemotaxis protein